MFLTARIEKELCEYHVKKKIRFMRKLREDRRLPRLRK